MVKTSEKQGKKYKNKASIRFQLPKLEVSGGF